MSRLFQTIQPNISTLRALRDALTSEHIRLGDLQLYVPGSLLIRLSVILGNLRMQRMLSTLLRPGDIVVDVGANIGYNTLYASQLVAQQGHVYALEPAQDNLAILYANLFANRAQNISVLPYAAGNISGVKRFYLRGEMSAVNSLYQDNFYHPITNTVDVLTAPLDELIPNQPSLIKIDVEGGELEVLQGMTRITTNRDLRLIIEWHPTLQQAAGHAPDALPKHLLALGYKVQIVSHTATSHLQAHNLPTITKSLLRKRSPVELLAMR